MNTLIFLRWKLSYSQKRQMLTLLWVVIWWSIHKNELCPEIWAQIQQQLKQIHEYELIFEIIIHLLMVWMKIRIKSNQKQFILPFNGGNTVQVNHEGRINKSIKTPWTALKTIECGSIGATCSRRPWILDYYIYTCHHVKNSEKAVINEKYQYVRIRKSNRF